MRLVIAAGLALLSLNGWAATPGQVIRKPTFIPAQSLSSALTALAKERGFQIVYVADEVDSIQTPGTSGELTTEEALTQLLHGTGFVFRGLDDSGGVTIIPVAPRSGAAVQNVQPNRTPLSESTSIGNVDMANHAGPAAHIRLAQADPPPSGPPAGVPSDSSSNSPLEEVIVTGVLSSRDEQRAAVAVTTLDAEQLRQLAPVSAADYLKDVPGVYVNSALGEIRNVVYTRGISANSQDGNNGYFYTSLQEDGLPVQNVLATNNGPDYYARPDIMTKRIEAVRGGASAIAGANAPGGLFNYISRNGEADPGTEVRTRFGAEGRGAFDNPYYRLDLYNGGSVSDSLSYAVGGFYRDATGPRDPGYSMNHGGQIRGNLRFNYGSGSLQLNAKYLDDHNLWDEFLPVQGFKNPRPLGTFNFSSSVNPPRRPHSFPALAENFPTGQPTNTDFWDPKQGINSISRVLGMNWDHRFDGGWSVSNKLKYSRNRSDWNSGAAIFAMPVNEPGIFGPAPFGNGILAVGTSGPNGVVPFTGTVSFTDRATGEVKARVQSTTNAQGQPVFNLLESSLPDDPALRNAILFQTAFAVETGANEVLDQLVLTRTTDRMTFDVGLFFGQSDLRWRSGEGGVGISQFTPARELLDVTILRDGADDPTKAGVVQAVTSPDGFAGLGKIGSFNNFASRVQQRQVSGFFGHSWRITDQLTIDSGVRYETISVEGRNQSASQFTDANGGFDGNVDTLFDNTVQALNPAVRYDENFDYWAYSPALSYAWNDSQSTYIRYAHSKKAPSLAAFIDPIDGVNQSLFIPETVEQIEIGHTVRGDRYSVTVTPFYTNLKNVGGFGSPIQFTDVDGTNYVRPPPLSNVETKGIEIEADLEVTSSFNLRTALTWADSTSTNNGFWNPGQPGRADDVIVSVPDGEALNQPDLIASATGTYRLSRGSVYATFRHMGERQANVSNTFQLPAYQVLDLGAQYNLTSSVDVQFIIKNVANSRGILSWQGVGGFDGLDRSRTPVNEVFSVVTVQPRAWFLTANFRL